MSLLKKHITFPLLAAVLAFCGCAHHKKIAPEEIANVFAVQSNPDDLATQFAPIFLIYDFQNEYNRIGRPSASYEGGGKEHIHVDTEKPATYFMVRKFTTDNDQYTNYIYRVHFPEVPFSLIPFYLTAGNNVGLMIFITVDSSNQPVLITTLHTCGCYCAMVPTPQLPHSALPENWKQEPLKVYGETLPLKLDYAGKKHPRLLVHVRPDVHRVMHLEVIEDPTIYNEKGFEMIPTPLVHMEALKRLPINGKTTSFYHNQGLLKGHVKGSVKLWESLLLSLISLDLFVGTDKVYDDTEITGNPFYTSLKPWNRRPSDIWNFAGFLKFWGWDL